MKTKFIAIVFAAMTLNKVAPAQTHTPPGKSPNLDFHGNVLPIGALARLGATSFYHEDGDHIAFSSDGKILATGGSEIVLWDFATGREIGRFLGEKAISGKPGVRPFARRHAAGFRMGHLGRSHRQGIPPARDGIRRSFPHCVFS